MYVHWSTVALDRVVEIAEYAGRDTSEAGERIVDALFGAAERLADFPYSGRALPELPSTDVREVIQSPYRLLYRVREDRVEILTVRHSRQQITPDDADLRG